MGGWEDRDVGVGVWVGNERGCVGARVYGKEVSVGGWVLMCSNHCNCVRVWVRVYAKEFHPPFSFTSHYRGKSKLV